MALSPDALSGAPNLDELRGGFSFFKSLQCDLTAEELAMEKLARIAYSAEFARRRIETGRLLREATNTARSQFLRDISAISTVAWGQRSAETSPNGHWSHDALLDLAASQVEQSMAARYEFKQLLEFEIGKMQLAEASRVIRATREMGSGARMTGLEQGECMRNARVELVDLVSASGGFNHPIGWLMLGWLSLWNSSFSSDAVSHFSHGLRLLRGRKGFLFYLLQRFLALALESGGRPAEALEAAEIALAERASPDMFLDVARYSIQCGRVAEAKAYLESAIRQDPALIFIGAGDPDMAPLEMTILACANDAASQVRKNAMAAIAEWETTYQRVHQAEKMVGITLDLPPETTSGFDSLRAYVTTTEFIEGLGVYSVARRNATQLHSMALRRLGALLAKRESEAQTVEQALLTAANKKESAAKYAKVQAESVILQTEADMRRSVTGDANTSTGCAMGLGGSLTMFLVYAVTAGALNRAGVDTGLDSPVGMLGAALIATPLVIGFGHNLSASIRQETVSHEVEKRASYAREMANAALEEVEKSCAEKADSYRRSASEIKSLVTTAAEALKLLQEIAPPPTLPVAQTTSQPTRRAA